MGEVLATNGCEVATKDLSQNLKNIINDITPNFEDNLKRGLSNEALRILIHEDEPIYLDDTLTFKNGNEIELMKLKLLNKPDFRINKFDLNLYMLHINLHLNLSTIHVKGEYAVNNKSLLEILPVTYNGTIMLDIENVTCEGIVGINIIDDSFVIENYDLNFVPNDIVTRVTFSNAKSEIIETKTSNSAIENSLAITFWNQLVYKLKEKLQRQLGGTIVEYSFSETMLDDEDILTEYRLFASSQKKKANILIDSFLINAKTYIVNNNLREIPIVGFLKSFKKPPPCKDIGNFVAVDGFMNNLSTLTRSRDFSLYEDNEILIAFGALRINTFKFGYRKYEATFQESKVSGSISSQLESDEIHVKLSVSKLSNPFVTKLESVKILNSHAISIDVSGLGSLMWLKDKLDSWIMGHLRCAVLSTLESIIEKSFKESIKTIQVEMLLEDQ